MQSSNCREKFCPTAPMKDEREAWPAVMSVQTCRYLAVVQYSTSLSLVLRVVYIRGCVMWLKVYTVFVCVYWDLAGGLYVPLIRQYHPVELFNVTHEFLANECFSCTTGITLWSNGFNMNIVHVMPYAWCKSWYLILHPCCWKCWYLHVYCWDLCNIRCPHHIHIVLFCAC